MNLKIYNLRQNLINDLSNSQLPIGVVYYILKDIFLEIENLYFNTIMQQQNQTKDSILSQQKVDFKIPLDPSKISDDGLKFHIDLNNLEGKSGQE